MTIRLQSRQTFPGGHGETRLFLTDESSLVFSSSVNCISLDWSTQDPAVLAIRNVLKHELAEGQLQYAAIMHGNPLRTLAEKHGKKKVIKKFFELTDAFERNPEDPASLIDYALFDFSTRAILLADLEPDITSNGISYIITGTDGHPLAADIAALRRAFLNTAEDSIKAELDWALGAFNS